ncbi:MAG: ABC transporter permease [Lachnospiraceae bacterium]|nr:ABC transporter permease [Lachnospiraceae bacterium]
MSKKTKAASAEVKTYKGRSQFREVMHRLRKNKGAIVGLIVFAIIVIIALLGDVLFDYNTDVIGNNIRDRLQAPNAKHWFGTDEMGRDLFARVLYGARYSLAIGFVSTLVSLAIGLVLGSIAGYKGGWVENVIMRITDIFYSLPSILLAIAVISALGQSMLNLMIAVGVSNAAAFCRVTRASVLTERGKDYVEAARAIGQGEMRIVLKHVVPNSLSPIIVQTTVRVAGAIISAAGLSFLGLGVPLPAPEWGSLLSMGRGFLRDYPYMVIAPGLAIMITVLSVNLFGDGLRDAIDPKLKR